jgi:uncharacterized protein YndB with AHSA1/START domain
MSESLQVQVRVPAPLKNIHSALTDADALRTWLAEYAEVEPPNRYEFWGRHTPEGDAPHQRLLHLDERTLRFSWLLDGEDTTVEIRLVEESDEVTMLHLSQTHFSLAEATSSNTVRGVLQTFWALSLANLVDYLAGRELTTKGDFTSAELRGEFLIAATPAAVYRSLTESEQITSWFGYPITIEPYVGGRFAMGDLETGYAAKIVDLVPDRTMSVDWAGAGITTWELAESDGGTRLTFVQSGFDTQHPPYSGWLGWLSGMAELRRYHELDEWRPIWVDAEPTTA